MRPLARDAIMTNRFVPMYTQDDTGTHATFPESLVDVCSPDTQIDPAFLHSLWRNCPFLQNVRLLIVTFRYVTGADGAQIRKLDNGQDEINPNSWMLMSDPRVQDPHAYRDVVLKLTHHHFTLLECSNAENPAHPIELLLEMAQDIGFPPPIETGHMLMQPLSGVDPADPALDRAINQLLNIEEIRVVQDEYGGF